MVHEVIKKKEIMEISKQKNGKKSMKHKFGSLSHSTKSSPLAR
jgi:hypothetical protein